MCSNFRVGTSFYSPVLSGNTFRFDRCEQICIYSLRGNLIGVNTFRFDRCVSVSDGWAVSPPTRARRLTRTAIRRWLLTV